MPCTSIGVLPLPYCPRVFDATEGVTVTPLAKVNARPRTVVPLAEETMSGTGVALGERGRVTAVNCCGLTTWTLSSGSPPRVAVISAPPVAVVAVGKLLPYTVIVVPPWDGPADGHTLCSDTLVPI